ncbi:MAG: DNA adenine methylase [Ktedonobacterales bacterium]
MLIPPIKCQGIKTKLVDTIRAALPEYDGFWIEPFCGSCVVPLNIQPKRAILADTNRHIINLYARIQYGAVTPEMVHSHLVAEGDCLRTDGESHYYLVRDRFNKTHDPLDFLFLNRSCFNGVMRFNARGEFNVPFCRNVERFSPAYVDRIVGYVAQFAEVSQRLNWAFVNYGFQQTLSYVDADDFVYADPPYVGRNNQYHDEWTDALEAELGERLRALPGKFMLSTWARDPKRNNFVFESVWHPGYQTVEVDHYYHVGPHLSNRHTVTEALVTNYAHYEAQPTERSA